MFSLLGGVLLLPVQLVADLLRLGRWLAQRNRFLSPHELNLRRASHPVGALALLLAAWWLYGAQLDAARAAYGVDAWLLAALASVAVIAGASSFVVGTGRCAGLRDGMLAARAFFKLTGGALLCFWLPRLPAWRAIDAAASGMLAPAMLLVGVWLLVTGCMRFVLLALPVSGALAKVRRAIDRNRNQWRSARRS